MGIFDELFTDTGATRRKALLDAVSTSLRGLSPDAGAEETFGRSIGASAGEAFLQQTMPDPSLGAAERRNAVLQSLDPNSIESLRAGINKAQAINDPVLVGKLAERVMLLEEAAKRDSDRAFQITQGNQRMALAEKGHDLQERKFRYRKKQDAADRAVAAQRAKAEAQQAAAMAADKEAELAEKEAERARKRNLEKNKALPTNVRFGMQAIFGKAPDEEYTDEELAQVRKMSETKEMKEALARAGEAPDVDTLAEVSKVLKDEAGFLGSPVVSPLEATLYVQKMGVVNPSLSIQERLEIAKGVLTGQIPNPLDSLAETPKPKAGMSFEEFKRLKREGKL